ncbi:MAG TPA: hypothetical protein VFJ16_05055 [Longimicrobium sp.]|nr:hypothetical protein [Longimicrobium sp.]
MNRFYALGVTGVVSAVSAICGSAEPNARAPGTVPDEVRGVQAVQTARADQVCVVAGDSLRMVSDTTVGGVSPKNGQVPAYPPYVERAPWYQAQSPVPFGGRNYVGNHPPQVIEPGLLVFVGRYRGVPVFKAAEDPGNPPEYIYLPVRPGCVFQPLVPVSQY